MTREEAIKAFQDMKRGLYPFYPNEYFDMAIKALEQEPKFIAKSDGTIEQIKNCNGCVFRKEWEKIGKLLSVVLEKQTEQEPRKGHWIVQPSNEEQGERPFIWWKCSKCGQVIFSETEHDRLEFHAFCGRCGADMRADRSVEDGNDKEDRQMRLVDIDKAREEYRNLMDLTMDDRTLLHTLYGVLDNASTVEAIPKEEVRQFIENIQKIKDNHNEYGEPINYGTICGILIEGYRLLDKYMEGKDGNDDL